MPRANTGSPTRRSPRDVAAVAVDDDAREAAPARLGGEQLAEHGEPVAVGGDHEHVARRGLGQRAEHRQVVVLGDAR